MAEYDRQRGLWKEMSPEVRRALSDLAFSADNTLVLRVKDIIQDNVLEDITEQGEQHG